MTDTYGGALARLRELVSEQVEGYRRLLEATRAGHAALRENDVDRFDDLLADQVDTMRELKKLEGDRRDVLRDVGLGQETDDIVSLREDLRRLVREVSFEQRISRLVIERNGALVDARLALHRRVGTIDETSSSRISRIA